MVFKIRKMVIFNFWKKRTWISVLRGFNRMFRFDLSWDFNNPKWRLKNE